MHTTNLKELRELRIQEKAIKARIDEISTEATNEAVAILAAQGEIKGEFEVEGIGKFQLQRTESFDFADYRRYPQEQAVKLSTRIRGTLSSTHGMPNRLTITVMLELTTSPRPRKWSSRGTKNGQGFIPSKKPLRLNSASSESLDQ